MQGTLLVARFLKPMTLKPTCSYLIASLKGPAQSVAQKINMAITAKPVVQPTRQLN